jgi:hypothetical protein
VVINSTGMQDPDLDFWNGIRILFRIKCVQFQLFHEILFYFAKFCQIISSFAQNFAKVCCEMSPKFREIKLKFREIRK